MEGAFIKWSDDERPQSDFVGYVIDGRGCHIWTGAKTRGYGRVARGRRMALVHRLRYEREVGPVPAGMQLDHFVCNNQACCNPRHVRPVTPRENRLRQQSVQTHCLRGHALTPDNLRPWGRRRGKRICAECDRIRSRKPRDRAGDA